MSPCIWAASPFTLGDVALHLCQAGADLANLAGQRGDGRQDILNSWLGDQ
jgi:hypothetical protein